MLSGLDQLSMDYIDRKKIHRIQIDIPTPVLPVDNFWLQHCVKTGIHPASHATISSQ